MTIEEEAVTNYTTAARAAKASFRVSLSLYVGLEIVDVEGYVVSAPAPSFRLTKIVFADGSETDVEGEHDHPYVVGGHPLLEYDVLEHLDGEVNQ